jgi:hypothetical protein
MAKRKEFEAKKDSGFPTIGVPSPVPKICKLFLSVAVVVAGDDGEGESQVTASRGQGKEGDRVNVNATE